VPSAHVQPIEEDIQTAEEIVEDENLNLFEMEKRNILKALQRAHYRRKAAAEDLGISERTLYRKIKDYGIEE
jgi:transcriptional regulator with PAS, ATPase and Fis domain